jgi:two-component system sensor histidine kinase MprB
VTLRSRLTLVATGVVAVVVVAASLTTYFVMRHQLYSQLDANLAGEAIALQRHPGASLRGPEDFGGSLVQVIAPDGRTIGGSASGIPVDRAAMQVATGRRAAFYRDISVNDYRLRELVAPLPDPLGAAIVVRNLDDVDAQLRHLRLILLLVSLGGIAAAALAGALVSRATLAPVRRLTAAAERIARTGDPSERVPETGRGELARLGSAFNTMLEALEESLETQRRFVADASHELRTPLTSLQTNLDVLRHEEKLTPEARQRLLDDLHRESQEMRTLIGGLLELARGDDPRLEKRELAFDELVEEAVDRARSRFPHVGWELEAEPTVVDGYPERLERAVWNLLENAGKWSGDGSTVEVTLGGGELRVRDHGPGIAPEERVLVFDRFYRSAAARAMPGSGLGLAIVREVAEAHGATVTAEDAPGGGALLRLSLNGAARPQPVKS